VPFAALNNAGADSPKGLGNAHKTGRCCASSIRGWQLKGLQPMRRRAPLA